MKDLAVRIAKRINSDLKPIHVGFDQSDRSSSREIYYRVPNIEKAKRMLKYDPDILLDEGIDRVIRNGSVRSR